MTVAEDQRKRFARADIATPDGYSLSPVCFWLPVVEHNIEGDFTPPPTAMLATTPNAFVGKIRAIPAEGRWGWEVIGWDWGYGATAEEAQYLLVESLSRQYDWDEDPA